MKYTENGLQIGLDELRKMLEYAENRAQELGLDERKAGTVAHIGKETLTDGQTAQAWLKTGYVRSVEQVTKSAYKAICRDYKGNYSDYDGKHPEWKGKRTAFLPGHGTTLFIEGVSFEIVEG